jgi:cell division protease FtsH
MADPPRRSPQPSDQRERTPWRVEGHPEGDAPGGGQQRRPSIPGAWGRFWWILLGLLAVNFLVSLALSGKPERLSVPYTVFYHQVQTGNVREISAKGEEIQGTFRTAVRYPPGKKGKSGKKFDTVRPSFGNDGLAKLLIDKNVTVNAHAVDTGTPLWQTILFGFGPTLLLVGLFIAIARRSSAGGGLGSFGRSGARRYEHSAQRTTFADVAGIDEAE